MFEKTIEKIVELAKPIIMDGVNGRVYSSKQIHPVLDPMPVPLQAVHTLTGLSMYLAINVDSLKPADLLIHVQTPIQVVLYGCLTGDFLQRAIYLQAIAEPPLFRFGNYYSTEDFIIAVQAMFCPTDDQQNILRIAGNLKQDTSTSVKDDGVTQQVTIKAGIARVEEVEVENPVALQPYRTFTEVEQPESSFIFRIRKSGQGMPECALFEADGGAWKLDAIQRIKDWIQQNTENVAVIA